MWPLVQNQTDYCQCEQYTRKIESMIWLAENKCIFHITQVQNCNMSANDKQHMCCQNFVHHDYLLGVSRQMFKSTYILDYDKFLTQTQDLLASSFQFSPHWEEVYRTAKMRRKILNYDKCCGILKNTIIRLWLLVVCLTSMLDR